MRLDRLLNEVDVFDRPVDARKIEVTSVTDDTTRVAPGSLFCCVIGSTRDGHEFAAVAKEKGAVALVVERDVDVDLPQVRVPDVRAALAPVASAFYDHPDKTLRIAGITGTNGKSTTAHIMSSLLRDHNWKTATVGTLTGHFTTPPAIDLQRILADLRDDKHNAVVMEVSSHALVQRRVDAIRFNVSLFTNLTQDHLDYHGTMGKYFEAKSMLFDPGRTEKAVVNVDDSWGRQLVDRLAVPMTPYSIDDAEDLVLGPSGSTFCWAGEEVKLPLIGRFNVYNALAAATAARSMGIGVSEIARGLSKVTSVPGRLERVDLGQTFIAVVDFAHTPDGLENVLNVARHSVDQRGGRVIVVFGCGGARDRGKRPQMGFIAEQLADLVFVTNDNPRDEAPDEIVQQILGGMQRPNEVIVELDRRMAIREAISEAGHDDFVVIAGKGHETTQEVAGSKFAFDDRLETIEAIELMQRTAPQSQHREAGS